MVNIKFEDRKGEQDSFQVIRDVAKSVDTLAKIVKKWKSNTFYLQKDYNEMRKFEHQLDSLAKDIDEFGDRVYDLFSRGKLYQPNKQKLI